MGKKAKEHRKKIAKRNEARNLEIRKAKKAQEELIKQLIEKERMAGKFDNPVVPGVSGPMIDIGNGPQI